MGERRIFNLDPDQLERLLSVGTGAEDPAKEPEQKRRGDEAGVASAKKPPPTKKKEVAGQSTTVSEITEQSGSRIGNYRVLSILGEGGMGIVYLAEQEQPIRRHVALKVIKPGMDSRRVIARFEAERQALALLDHPNIAHIHDAGTTDSGRPFFAMEYVEGFPITEHCDHHKLTIEERLRLFLQICYAVHHAHQKGIIHRDIKPSNILVSSQDDQAVPKIIDFGVAKAIDQPLTERTLFTEQGQLFGTPEYMSPEQADMANEDIDTQSDIYSLGVLLYVLLTGVLPFDADSFRQGGIEHIRRVIRETEPKTPSTRLTNLGPEAAKVAESRRTELATLTRSLHRELEWIPLKAMRKERSERYRSASELADDVENYLHCTPLMAGPPKTMYKLRKFMKRNRALVAGVAAVLVVLIAGIIASTLFAFGQARTRAEAQAVSDFLRHSVLESLDPFKVGGKEITIRSVFDTASESLEGEFTGTPLAEAGIRYTVGNAYWSLGLYERAELHLERARAIQQANLGPENVATLLSTHYLGWLCFSKSRYSRAEQLLTQALEARSRVLGEEDADTLLSMVGLACVYNMQGRFKEAEELIEKALEITRRVLGDEHPHVPAFMNAMAWSYELQGRYHEAEQLVKQGLKIGRRVRGENDWFTLLLKHTLSRVYLHLGRYDEAEEPLQETLSGRRESWGQEHPDTLETMATLGQLYHAQGQYDEAESYLDQALENSLRMLGDSHFVTAECMRERGALHLNQGQYDEAGPLLEKALEITVRILGEESWTSLSVKNTLGRLYTAQGRYSLAHQSLLDALECRQRILGEDHPDTLESKNDLAVLYMRQGDYDKAEPLLLKAVKGRRLKLSDTHPHTIESLNNLIDLYEAWGKPGRVEEWRARLPQTDNMSK
jgi:serine/threonine protein kinase/Flp pilus assembly protein TadD